MSTMINEEKIVKQIYQEDGMWIGEISGRILFKDKSEAVVERKLGEFVRNMNPELFKASAYTIYSNKNE